MPFKRKDRGYEVQTKAYKFRIFPEYQKPDFDYDLKSQIFAEARLYNDFWNELVALRQTTLDRLDEAYTAALAALREDPTVDYQALLLLDRAGRKPGKSMKTKKNEVVNDAPVENYDQPEELKLKSSTLKKHSPDYAEKSDEIWRDYEADFKRVTQSPESAASYSPDLRDDVVIRFKAAHEKALKAGIKLEPRRSYIEKFRFAHRFTGGGKSVETVSASRSKKFRIEMPESDLYADEKYRMRLERVTSGTFGVGLGDHLQIPFRAVLHREIPKEAFIKTVAFCGKNTSGHWEYSLVVSVDEPAAKKSEKNALHHAGLDLGWRTMGDYLRVGVISDSAGNLFELRLNQSPHRTARERRFERLFSKHGNLDKLFAESGRGNAPRPRTWSEISEMKTKRDEEKDAVKAVLKEMELPDNAEIKSLMARLTVIGRTGLGKLLRLLENLPDREQTGDTGKAIEMLSAFQRNYQSSLEIEAGTRSQLINRRQNTYRNLAAWLRKNYALVAFEGNLNLKQMSEDAAHASITTSDGAALKNSAKFRTYAALSEFTGYLKEASGKTDWLRSEDAAGTTTKCAQCGLKVKGSPKLYLVCENGHKTDQDAQAAINLRRRLPTPVGDFKGAKIIIPENLRDVIVQIQG